MQNSPIQMSQPQPTPQDDQGPISPLNPSRQVMTISPPVSTTSSTRPDETNTTSSSPRNCHSAIITPTRADSGGSVDVGSGSGEQRGSGFNLRRGSSSESLSESNVYTVPIKYRSGAGSFEEHVACGFANLFSSSELSDVTIACEGKLIKAHKLVLAISSPYFRQIFEKLHDFPCQHPVVILHGVKLKDWENIMRLIYCGIVHVSSTEIDDFISTAECLKIDGLAAEEPGSSHEDGTPPYEYFNRLSSSEFQSPEHVGTGGMDDHGKSRFTSYSPDEYTAKDFRYDRGGTSPDPNPRDGDVEQSLLIRCRRTQGQGSNSREVRVISSAQSSPGLGTHSASRDTPLKVETNYGHSYDGNFSHDTQRPPSCPEGFRVYSQPNSPIETRVQAVRHPVISRRRGPEIPEDSYEVPSETMSGFIPTLNRIATARHSHSRPSTFQSGWDHRNLNAASEAVVIDETDRPFPSVISAHRSPIAPTMTPSTGHGVTTRYPLSVISRQPPASIPLQLLNPAAAGFLHRIPQLQLVTQRQRSPHGEAPITAGGVITTVPSPHSSPQSHDHQHQQSTLAILRAKIAAGHPIYSRGYRPDRQTQHANNLFLPRFPSAAIGSANQLSPHDLPGTSRPNIFVPSAMTSNQHPQSIARPKTKAIRSSQVPQSARYTAAEVDAMVDKVQNFPGNMVPCAICSKFVKRERLRAHIHECHLLHGKRIVCPHCGIGLKSKGSYRVHIWRHKRGALPASSRQRHTDHPPHSGSQNPN